MDNDSITWETDSNSSWLGGLQFELAPLLEAALLLCILAGRHAAVRLDGTTAGRARCAMQRANWLLEPNAVVKASSTASSSGPSRSGSASHGGALTTITNMPAGGAHGTHLTEGSHGSAPPPGGNAEDEVDAASSQVNLLGAEKTSAEFAPENSNAGKTEIFARFSARGNERYGCER